MTPLSSYILTHNSEMHIGKILEPMSDVADEIIVVDSGSNDRTKEIAESFSKVKFIFHPFKNFKEQRIFAEKSCSYDLIFFLDSDEIPNITLIENIKHLKETDGFNSDAYTITRKWNVLGKNIHSIYPVVSPDNPIRLYNRKNTSFEGSQLVHESVTGYKDLGHINGEITHITFESINDFKHKLELYTNIAANDLIIKKKKNNIFKRIFSPIGAFIKWYFLKSGYKDGRIGLITGQYAYRYTKLKYIKAKNINK
jgi:glycosyltransferase involved in cell wall biosynthesis